MKSLYKVVADEGGVLRSAMNGHIGEVGITYGVGNWAKPKIEGSKLFCFPSMRKARAFIKDFKFKLRVFRCKAKNPKLGEESISATLDQESVLHFWGKADKPKFYMVGKITAVVADEIMLTKEVKP